MENEIISRNKEHELIMVALYDALIYVALKEEFSVEDILSGLYEMPYEDVPYFSKEVVIKSLVNLNDIIANIQKFMRKWAFDRLNSVIKAILISSYTKGKLIKEPIDKSANIDVAIRLAKKYAEPNDSKFVNGILDNLL